MEFNGNRQQAENQPVFAGSDMPIKDHQKDTGAAVEPLVASDVMSLVFEVTQTSAEIYELVASLSWALLGLPIKSQLAANPLFRRHLAPLQKISIETEASVRRLRKLESNILNPQPELFDTFLDDCSETLVAFRASILDLAGLINPDAELDENRPQDITATEMLVQVVDRLKDCSEKVSNLPEKGILVSYQIMVGTALDLRHQAVGIVEKTIGNY